MENQTNEQNDLRNEFRNLADNLKKVMGTAWESEERKKLQRDIQAGMQELGTVLDGLATDFHQSEVGQTVRREVEDFSARVCSGEIEAQARRGIFEALRALNAELEKAAEKFSKKPEE